MNIKKEEVINFIINKVKKLTKNEESEILAHTSLSSVGVDSLSAVLICGYIEDEYNIEVEPIIMFECKNANEVANEVIRLIEEQL
ncbi:acyl carrier protein [Malaciobacter mytili]|uniref:Carrier domain-containing protein n=1 Tax=Malaciobacter mytili LMG 24559 TaxID=1032238 RepID=A0AAX2AGA9_9BACT|nr:acyl carrier protein [Malaciobacter mytili]AXH16216.1 PP-binding domain-containing protein [Malaciobacter mytili LMG 24559]RXI36659.1 hypothetical protein CRU99_13285 [Malaciobacter mytili]RXK13723.1 hypothetical protein CP985_13030 [Malaciobacter mytili LMG 24559]